MELINLKLKVSLDEQLQQEQQKWYEQINLNIDHQEEQIVDDSLVDPLWMIVPQALKEAWATTKILINADVIQNHCHPLQAIALLKQNHRDIMIKISQYLTNLVFKGQLVTNELKLLAANQTMILINQSLDFNLINKLIDDLKIKFIYVIDQINLKTLKDWLKQAGQHWDQYQIVQIKDQNAKSVALKNC